MHGPPGCGKSSFVAALAGELGYDICVLNLSDAGLTDDRLAHALSTTPPTSLVLLEDVDAAFVARDPTDRRSSHVTFSGLLNALDGVAAGEERILFMTTNHLERLDPALIRPGRVDVIRQIGLATPSQCHRLFLKFFPDETELAQRFVDTISPAEISMALLQAYFMMHRHSPSDACGFAHELREGCLAAAAAPSSTLPDPASHQDSGAGGSTPGRGVSSGGAVQGAAKPVLQHLAERGVASGGQPATDASATDTPAEPLAAEHSGRSSGTTADSKN